MLIPAAITAITSSVFLIRDLYHFVKYTETAASLQQQQDQKEKQSPPTSPTRRASSSHNNKNQNNKKKNDDDDDDQMHQIPHNNQNQQTTSSSTHAGNRDPSTARLSALEEKGVALARLRSVRILAFLALILISSLIVTDAQSAASSLYEAYQSSPSISSTTGIAILCKNVIKASQSNTYGTVSLLFSLYLVLQTFSIPGTIALNAVLGALLGTGVGVFACVLAGTAGACCCYTLSSAIGSSLAHFLDKHLMKSKGIHQLRTQVNKYRSELLAYLLFLRFTPILPNWLINLASPILGIPLKTFAIATFFGIIPQTYLSVRFGTAAKTLSENMDAGNDQAQTKIVTIYDTFLIALLGIAVVGVNKLKSRFAEKETNKA